MKAWDDRLSGLTQKNDPKQLARNYANDQYTEVYKSFADKQEAAIREAAVRVQTAQRDAWAVQHDDWTAAGHRTAQDEADYWSIKMLEADQGSENWKEAAEKELAAERASIKSVRKPTRHGVRPNSLWVNSRPPTAKQCLASS